MSVSIVGRAAVRSGDEIPVGMDPNRLRRMDRFARAGFLAGSGALHEAGVARATETDPRAGIVFGTAYGCRDSIADHAMLLSSTTTLAELRPMLFAETVHNTANGELAIEWNLGGVSEVIVSGRCAGLEALVVAARRLEDGSADRVVVGAAEGLHPTMHEAWRVERLRYGARAEGVELEELGVALVLERGGVQPGKGVRLVGGTCFFEPDPELAGRRTMTWACEALGGFEGLVYAASPDLDGAFSRESLARLGFATFGEVGPDGEVRVERLGAAGPYGVLTATGFLLSGVARQAVVVTRDPEGPTAAVALRA